MASSFDYYALQQESSIRKVYEEIAFYEASEYKNVPFIAEYIAYLKSRVERGGKFIPPSSYISTDKDGNRTEIVKMNVDEYQRDVMLSNFQREWKKLKPIHKSLKITEYVNKLDGYPKNKKTENVQKNRAYLKEELTKGLTEKRFLKGKSEIEYDSEKGFIESISCVDFNKKKGLYEIDWDS